MLKRLAIAVLLACIAAMPAYAVIVKYTLSQNLSGSTVGAIHTTAFPNGDAPLDDPGASCAHWTKLEKVGPYV
jgi:hypothetical protein